MENRSNCHALVSIGLMSPNGYPHVAEDFKHFCNKVLLNPLPGFAEVLVTFLSMGLSILWSNNTSGQSSPLSKV